MAIPSITLTGSSGLVGSHTKNALLNANEEFDLIFADRKPKAVDFNGIAVKAIPFDFEEPITWESVLSISETLFLLRPPQLSDVDGIFKPLIDAIKQSPIKHIVFLSVQGAPEQSIIPHHKIEALIVESGINYTFLRPGYFMQNFEGNLKADLVDRHQIDLPAGYAKFALLDVMDLGRVAAKVLLNPGQHINKGYDLTGPALLTFQEMAATITNTTGIKINYKSAGILPFMISNWQKSVPFGLNMVMTLLHYMPRWMVEPPITNTVLEITGEPAGSFEAYVERVLKGMLV
jgi:uncharacterized protein YbjT (DUF2867 family)